MVASEGLPMWSPLRRCSRHSRMKKSPDRRSVSEQPNSKVCLGSWSCAIVNAASDVSSWYSSGGKCGSEKNEGSRYFARSRTGMMGCMCWKKSSRHDLNTTVGSCLTVPSYGCETWISETLVADGDDVCSGMMNPLCSNLEAGDLVEGEQV